MVIVVTSHVQGFASLVLFQMLVYAVLRLPELIRKMNVKELVMVQEIVQLIVWIKLFQSHVGFPARIVLQTQIIGRALLECFVAARVMLIAVLAMFVTFLQTRAK
jgi:hypothetical protein